MYNNWSFTISRTVAQTRNGRRRRRRPPVRTISPNARVRVRPRTRMFLTVDRRVTCYSRWGGEGGRHFGFFRTAANLRVWPSARRWCDLLCNENPEPVGQAATVLWLVTCKRKPPHAFRPKRDRFEIGFQLESRAQLCLPVARLNFGRVVFIFETMYETSYRTWNSSRTFEVFGRSVKCNEFAIGSVQLCCCHYKT